MITQKHDNFKLDVLETIEYYSQFDIRLGIKFISNLNDAIDLLETYPNSRPVLSVEDDIKLRRVKIKSFPYAIYYSFEDSEQILYLYGVVCERRNPMIIRKLLKGRK